MKKLRTEVDVSRISFRNLSNFGKDPLGFLESVSARPGPVKRVSLGFKDCHFVTCPQLIKELFVKNTSKLVRKDFFSTLHKTLGDGLVTIDGDRHRRVRSMMAPAFMSKNVLKFKGTMESCALDSTTRLQRHESSEKPVDLSAELTETTLEIAFRSLFGSEFNNEEAMGAFNSVSRIVGERLFQPVQLWRYFPTSAKRQYKKSMRILDDLILKLVSARRASGERKADFLSLILDAQEESSGQVFTDKEVRDHLITLAFAGHETTATSLMWLFKNLADHPSCLKKCVESFQGETDSDTRSYFEKCVMESMRLSPTVWFIPRNASEDIELSSGHLIKKGSLIIIPTYTINRDSNFWENPIDFNPDRFSSDLKSRPDPFKFFPFGIGHHHCIGHFFAELEFRAIAKEYLSKFRFEIVNRRQILPVPHVTLRVSENLMARIKATVDSKKPKTAAA